MKPRRPPLNLTDPKSKTASRAATPKTPESDADDTAAEDALLEAPDADDDDGLDIPPPASPSRRKTASSAPPPTIELKTPEQQAAAELFEDKLADEPAVVEPPVPETPEPEAPIFEAPAFETPVFETPVFETPEPEAPMAEKLPEDDLLEAPLHDDTGLGIAPTDTIGKPAKKPGTFSIFDEPPPIPDSALTPPAKRNPQKPQARVEPEMPQPQSQRTAVTPVVHTEAVLKATGGSPAIYYGGAFLVSLLWAAGLIGFVYSAEVGTSMAFAPARAAILGLLALFPSGLVFAAAFALRNAAALSRQSARAAALADAMLAPATAAAQQTQSLVDSLRDQVDHAVRAVRLAHNDITELSARLKSETDRLHDSANLARSATQAITQSMEQERDAVARMSSDLGVQAAGIIEAVDRQARMVADASDLAQTQLQEAEATLAARATDMMAAATDVTTTARSISDDLDRQSEKLQSAGTGVVEQIRVVEEGLSQQRAGLVQAALSLRADQEDFAVHIENQRAQLTEALAITRVATVDLGETSAKGVDVLRDIVLTAQENFRAVTSASENERTAFETRVHATLSNISTMAADARDDLINETKRALEQLNSAAGEARRAADAAAQTAQQRVDRLNESIFEASKKADEVFDSRFNAARRLIEDSADLITEAGDQTAQKLDDSFSHTRRTIAEVNEALTELTNNADQLPLMAQDRLHEIRRSVEEGLQALTAAAQKAALETEAIDKSFQDRVKRNYEMLTEAVRLMGVISGDQPIPGVADGGYRATRAVTPPQPMPRPVAPQTPQAEADRARRVAAQNAETRPSPGPQAQPQPRAAQPAPRPAPQPQPPAQQPQSGKDQGQGGWSWRDLLNGMERQPAPQPQTAPEQLQAPQPPADVEFDSLDDIMVAEVAAMGVDAPALLSRARVDEIIGAVVAEDNEGARLVVRRVAPAAIRRLARRLVADPVLRQQANDFATFYDEQVNMALMSKDVTRGLQEVLNNDKGRAYLLIDAAIADMI